MRHGRARTWLAVGAVGAVAMLTAFGPTAAGAAPATVTSTADVPHGHGLTAADPRISDHIELKSRRVRAGHPIAGTLVVTSTASGPINLARRCRPQLEVVIDSRTVRQRPAFAAVCSPGRVIIRPGSNRIPVSVATTHLQCLGPGGTSRIPLPRCGADGHPPPLPPGVYHTVLFGDGALPLPEPAAVTVTLTKP